MSNTEQLITIDDLTNKCGFFNRDTNINNGYGCNHPDCDAADVDENGKIQGKCYTFSCPVAYEADLQDLRRLDADLAQQYENDALEDGTIESDLMVWRKSNE